MRRLIGWSVILADQIEDVRSMGEHEATVKHYPLTVAIGIAEQTGLSHPLIS